MRACLYGVLVKSVYELQKLRSETIIDVETFTALSGGIKTLLMGIREKSGSDEVMAWLSSLFFFSSLSSPLFFSSLSFLSSLSSYLTATYRCRGYGQQRWKSV